MSIETIYEYIEKGLSLTPSEKRIFIDNSITHHNQKKGKTSKMDRIDSISTSALCNVNCALRAKNPDYVCNKCFARTMLKKYPSLQKKCKRNTLFYTNYELSKKDIPLINATCFRFESFGELFNTLQVKNYFTIARANKQTTFALWTKQPEIIAAAMKEYRIRKPGNMIIISSQYDINGINATVYKKHYRFIDKVFSVYTKDFARENGVTINCNGKCVDCMKCYNKQDETVYINELEKSEQRRGK